MPIKRTEQELRNLRKRALETADLWAVSLHSRDTYESGIVNTIDWILGEGPAADAGDPDCDPLE